MSQSVTIKSNKYGINLVLDADMSFADLIKAVVEKFKASANFFKNAKLAISFEGRHLSDDEQQQIIAAIEENTTIEILCIVENGTEQEAIMKEQVEAFNEAVQKQCENVATVSVPELQHGLVQAGIVESLRGVHGGMRLKVSPDDVTIRQVVEAVQGPMVMNDCTAPDGDCARMGTCCYHPLWAGAQALMRDYLDSVSLGDIVAHRQFPAVDPKFADRDAFPEYAACAYACREE